MDVLGHDDIDHAELYSREASQIRLAVQGMDRVVRLVTRKPLLGEPTGEPRGEPPHKQLINNDNGGAHSLARTRLWFNSREITGISEFFWPLAAKPAPNLIVETDACRQFPCSEEQGIAGRQAGKHNSGNRQPLSVELMDTPRVAVSGHHLRRGRRRDAGG